jgi:hypothetical protein
MSKQSFQPTDDVDDITVCVGAYVPYRLYRLLVAEAEQAGLSRSKMIGRALAERYEQKGTKEQEA